MKGIAPFTQHMTGEHYRSSMFYPSNAIIMLNLYQTYRFGGNDRVVTSKAHPLLVREG